MERNFLTVSCCLQCFGILLASGARTFRTRNSDALDETATETELLIASPVALDLFMLVINFRPYRSVELIGN